MTISDSAKLPPTVVPSEAPQTTTAARESALTEQTAATEQTTTATSVVPQDAVESGVQPGEQLWGAPKTGTTPPPAPPADATAATDSDTQVYNENFGLSTEGLHNLADDALTAAFMKVNILNPDEEVENQDNLIQALSELQQRAIENAKQELKNLRERIKELEKDAKEWGATRAVLAVFSPASCAYELGRACGMDQGTAGILSLSWTSLLVDNEHQTAKAEVQTAKDDLAEANRRWSRGLRNLGLDPNDENFQRWLEEMAEASRKETASADEEGVPTKGIGKKLKPAMNKILDALGAIGDAQGLLAMMEAAPGIITEALVPELQALGVENPEGVAQAIAAGFCLEVLARLGVMSDQALGASTMLLGHKLDDDSPVELPDDPAEALARAAQATSESLSASSFETVRSLHDQGLEA